MPYQPLQNNGIVGKIRTATLNLAGESIGWPRLSHFESPTAFGAILEPEKGRPFRIPPPGVGEEGHRHYDSPQTDALIMQFLHCRRNRHGHRLRNNHDDPIRYVDGRYQCEMAEGVASNRRGNNERVGGGVVSHYFRR
jgi:hypothetical protein